MEHQTTSPRRRVTALMHFRMILIQSLVWIGLFLLGSIYGVSMIFTEKEFWKNVEVFFGRLF